MKKYTIESRYYGNSSLTVFDDRGEWMDAIDRESNKQHSRGYDDLIVSIYDVPEDAGDIEYDRAWNGKEYRGRRSYVDTVSIPEEWDLIDTQHVGYWWVDEFDGTWRSESDRYDTEDEAIEAERPSQYLYI